MAFVPVNYARLQSLDTLDLGVRLGELTWVQPNPITHEAGLHCMFRSGSVSKVLL